MVRMIRKRVTLSALLFTLLAAANIAAQEYLLTSAIGWATGTTGGGNAAPTVVTTEAQFRSALRDNAVIIINGSFELSGDIRISNRNLTILGTRGSTISASTPRGIGIRDADNIIIRNLRFVGPGAASNQGSDPLEIRNSTRIWVDHCEFIDGADGNFDIRTAANYITATWNKFSYTSRSIEHQFSNLIGSSDTDTGDRGHLKVTFQYNWWADGVRERMPRVRFGQVHIVNNLYTSAQANHCIRGGLEADLYIDRNVFSGTRTPLTNNTVNNNAQSFRATFATDNILNNVSGTNTVSAINALGGRQGNASWNPYTTNNYTIRPIAASSVQAAVSNAQCGAGATLNITTAGVISSPCSPTPPAWTLIGSGEFIDSLRTTNTANAANWSIQSNLRAGVAAYGDRTHQITHVTSFLQGAEWVRPAMDSRTMTADTLVRFRMKKSGMVYIIHEDRVTTKPSWLAAGGFQGIAFTGMDYPFTVSDGQERVFTKYGRRFEQGETVALGRNSNDGMTSTMMYIVAVQAGTTSIINRNIQPTNYGLNVARVNNGAIAVSYSIKDRGNVRLDLFDVRGVRVRTLVNTAKDAGAYREYLSTSGLAAGMYVVKLRAGRQVLQDRVVVAR